MKIISHRGYWILEKEKNTADAFRRSFDLGFGIETDIRDRMGELVIAHDMPRGGEMALTEMLDILGDRNLPLAMNIKADGIAENLSAELQRRSCSDWFTFDMSVPELIRQLRTGIPAYTRASDYESTPNCYHDSKGIWLDAFDSDWYEAKIIEKFLHDNKQVCIVSSELHKRDPAGLWSMLKSSALSENPGIMLCTDFPEKARSYFGD